MSWRPCRGFRSTQITRSCTWTPWRTVVFDNGQLLQGEHSLYISNLQTGNLGVRFV